MMTTLIELATTGSAIGLIASCAALGIAVLPWRADEARDTARALDTAIRLPVLVLGQLGRGMAPVPH